MDDKPFSVDTFNQTSNRYLSSAMFPTPSQSASTSASSSTSLPRQPERNMLPPIASTVAMDARKKPLDISSLMSPPDPVPYDSFSQGQVLGKMSSAGAVGPRMPMSPPVSPMTKANNHGDAPATPASLVVKDPILYPREESAPSPPQQPLFMPTEYVDHRRIVKEHIAARPAGLFRESSPPRPEHYELALHFKSQVMKHFSENRGAWLRKERMLLMADRKASGDRSHGRLPTLLPAKPIKILSAPAKPVPRLKTSPKGDRITKPQGPRPIRTHQPTPSRQVIRVSATPEPTRRVVAPNREDRDFGSLPDYCPPVSSLPDRPNSLKVDWKGAPIDLSQDPNAGRLHPDELILAANLRLDCATYLTSKRRIFIRRLECEKVGKEFRKTDAQQACKIDVNKASKLWTAFDKVGWLQSRWMSPFMH